MDLLNYSMEFASTPSEAIKNLGGPLFASLCGLDLPGGLSKVVDVRPKSLHIGSSILEGLRFHLRCDLILIACPRSTGELNRKRDTDIGPLDVLCLLWVGLGG